MGIGEMVGMMHGFLTLPAIVFLTFAAMFVYLFFSKKIGNLKFGAVIGCLRLPVDVIAIVVVIVVKALPDSPLGALSLQSGEEVAGMLIVAMGVVVLDAVLMVIGILAVGVVAILTNRLKTTD